MAVFGTVFKPDYDLAVVKRLGGEIVNLTVDGEVRTAYAATVAGSEGAPGYGDRVPIFLVYPEAVFVPRIMPCFVVRPGAPETAWDRRSWYGIAKRAPAEGANPVTVTLPDGTEVDGFDSYVEQWRGEAYNLPYDVQLYGRTQRGEAAIMPLYLHAMKRFVAPSFPVKVLDSLSDERVYDCINVSWSDNSDLDSPTQRRILMQVSFQIMGEFEIVDEKEYPSVQIIEGQFGGA